MWLGLWLSLLAPAALAQTAVALPRLEAPLLLLGEVHDNAAQHAMRLQALQALAQRGARPALLLSCLELLRMLAPGSESHTAVAQKYDAVVRQRVQLMEALIKKVSGSPARLPACLSAGRFVLMASGIQMQQTMPSPKPKNRHNADCQQNGLTIMFSWPASLWAGRGRSWAVRQSACTVARVQGRLPRDRATQQQAKLLEREGELASAYFIEANVSR